jgi:hypothetical protein
LRGALARGLAGFAAAAGVRLSLRGLVRRADEPPVRSARASSSETASSSVMVSGVLSAGSVALMPS